MLLRDGLGRDLDSAGPKIKGPAENEGDREAAEDKINHQPGRPGWEFKDGKKCNCDLNDQPAGNGVGDRDAINFAPPQLTQKPVKP